MTNFSGISPSYGPLSSILAAFSGGTVCIVLQPEIPIRKTMVRIKANLFKKK
jgi:hypothetical protein